MELDGTGDVDGGDGDAHHSYSSTSESPSIGIRANAGLPTATHSPARSLAAPPRTAECNPWRRRDAYLFVLIIHAANSLKSTYGRAIQVSSEGVRPVVGWEPHIATSVLVDILHDLVKLCCGKLDVTLGHQFSYLLLDQSACFAVGARGQIW